jgi:aryl-alcohol dehydrogenase-like predicted oxidoreductase
VTLFDTAQAYGFGASEQLLAKALTGLDRSKLIIATKGGLRPGESGGVSRDSSPAWIRAGVESSLRALNTDYIDLYQVHWPDPAVPLADTAETLAKLVADAKVRHVGVSNFDARQMAEFNATLQVEALQPPYHLFRRDIEASTLPYAAAHDIGVLVYGPLAHGLLSGSMTQSTTFAPQDWRSRSDMFTGDQFARNLRAVSQLAKIATSDLGVPVSRLAVAWTLANPAVHTAIVGTRSPDHIDDAIAAADLDLGTDVLRQIDGILTGAAPAAGPTPDSV